MAYAALLRNELLGAGIDTVPDPHTDDRRHAVLSQDSHSLFRVWAIKMMPGICFPTEVTNTDIILMKSDINKIDHCGISISLVFFFFLCTHPLQYTVHTKRVPFDSDNEVSPYSLSPLSNKR